MSLGPRSKEAKKYRDNAVTGDYVRLSAVAVSIVDTPIFQRLRYLKQLGTAEYVYPGATHTRFAHSLGVAHRAKASSRTCRGNCIMSACLHVHCCRGCLLPMRLAVEVLVGLLAYHSPDEHGRMTQIFQVFKSDDNSAPGLQEFALRLAAKQPELALSDSDLLVLEVAGLCHDLGHGPFSHAFESELVPRVLPPGQHWEHEEQSCILFDHICEHYQIDLSPDEQQRVKDLIIGDREAAQADWAGREWQFDIVANKRNGLDVDKLDYLKRDNSACGELTTSEFSSLYENMKVIDGQVCFRSSVRSAVQEVYSARARLHEFVYTHPVAKAVEMMVMDALASAAGEIGIAEALQDPERFALLDDTVLREIERSPSQSPGMARAQELLRRLRHRDIYKHVGSVDIPHGKVLTFRQVDAAEILEHQEQSSRVQLAPGDVRVHNLRIDYTSQHQNPLRNVGLYVNEGDAEAFYPEENPFAPGTFITRQVRAYLVRLCSSPEEKHRYAKAVKAAFANWCKRVLQTELLISPQKSTLTASARKRAFPGSSTQLAALAGGDAPRAGSSQQLSAGNDSGAAAAEAAGALDGALQQLQQSEGAGQRQGSSVGGGSSDGGAEGEAPAAKKHLAFAGGGRGTAAG